ncbi:MAG: phosphoenolpyruvate carboxylase [Actinomycetota bacterium]|nr:phosphoenolpyruvate carboxylase [Actinomycetota bacterium]
MSDMKESPQRLPAALRREVRLLTTMLGQAIEESHGPELLADVERLRKAAIALREEPTPGREEAVLEGVGSFGVDRAEAVARAFTCYFQLVNLAEEHQRIRALREQSRGDAPVADSIAAAAGSLDHGTDLEITLVLTAHPTEAKRRAVVENLWRIAELIDGLDDPRLESSREAELRRRISEEVTALWTTDPVRPHRPEPLDEVRAAMALFDHSVFDVLPLLYRELDAALGPEDVGNRPPAFSSFLSWGSWIGGDRDGNPSVTAEVTSATLEIHAQHILHGLEDTARRIARGLSASERDVPPSDELAASLEIDERELPERSAELRRNLPDSPHRRKLELAAERIARTREDRPGGYPSPDAFLADLSCIQRSLEAAGTSRLAYGALQHLIWQAETFGFHLASLEVRQHSEVHAEVLRELAPEAAGDARALDRIAAGGPVTGAARSETAAEALATFRAMADLQGLFGADACRRVIVSFTRSAADVAAVRALFRLAVPDGSGDVDVVPLFESRHELERATEILDDVVELPEMRRWLDRCGDRLEVMLGYSDSAKEAGVLSANLLLYDTQARLASWARDHDLRLTIFHGRGGALGRGGGPTNRAILGQPPGSVPGRFKVTEQGEVAFARYGNAALAKRHLEQITNAVIVSSSSTVAPDPAAPFSEEISLLREVSERAYRSLVEADGFVEFFRRSTPIEEIGTLPIASRPAHRAQASEEPETLESLRAIPWVFAWTQNRANVPGWYGLGSGLAAVGSRGPDGREALRRMFRDWPFFTSFIENAELSLSKADLGIASHYLALGGDADLSRAIREEFELTRERVLDVAEHDRLLDCRPQLQTAVQLRNPYVDALSFLQLRFLPELRSGASHDPRIERLVQATISGVAAGLQNTG